VNDNTVQRASKGAGGRGGSGVSMPAMLATEPVTTTVVLGRPTDSSMTLSVLPVQNAEAVIAYGEYGSALSSSTPTVGFSANEPREIVLEKLAPSTRYAYRLLDSGSKDALVEGTFVTPRAPGTAFTFTITADPHLDGNTDPLLWQQTLSNVASDKPDFHIDLGDTFMTDKYGGNRADASRHYLAQRGYFGALAHSVPLYLVVGNHDGESGGSGRDRANGEAVWSNTMRKTYFPNPMPNSFYTGDSAEDPDAGLLQDYYAWEWGDALFVVLNPYWNSTGPKDDGWGLTLGDAQYAWLRKALAESDATYKFVFIHQLAGGLGQPGRGGAEAAQFGEWGGKNQDGSNGFAQHRPGWDSPVHDLLAANGVTAVFHGHDHLYANQELDGIVYQEVPQPAQSRAGGMSRQAAEYGYTQGTILGSSGHLRVTVAPDRITSQYVRAVPPTQQRAGNRNGGVAHSYTVKAPVR
jgi:hypothetical protein